MGAGAHQTLSTYTANHFEFFIFFVCSFSAPNTIKSSIGTEVWKCMLVSHIEECFLPFYSRKILCSRGKLVNDWKIIYSIYVCVLNAMHYIFFCIVSDTFLLWFSLGVNSRPHSIRPKMMKTINREFVVNLFCVLWLDVAGGSEHVCVVVASDLCVCCVCEEMKRNHVVRAVICMAWPMDIWNFFVYIHNNKMFSLAGHMARRATKSRELAL